MRLFLALDLPPSARRWLVEGIAPLREREPGWRWVRIESLHLTVRFLGEVDAETDDRARSGWRRAAASAPPLRLRLAGLGTFPSHGRPRVLWVGVGEIDPSGALAKLGAAVEREARAAGFEAEERPFRPHLTLARAARTGAPRRPTGDSLDGGVTVEARELVLFESRLGPAGARYTARDSFPLGG